MPLSRQKCQNTNRCSCIGVTYCANILALAVRYEQYWTITAIVFDSMTYRPLRFLATWFGVLAFLANTTVFGSGWVLCAEPDGRIAIEFAGDFNPCLTAPMLICLDEEAECATHFESNAQCACEPCPCKDTPLGIELAPRQERIQLINSNHGDPSTGLSIPYLLIIRYSDADRVVVSNFNSHLGYRAQMQSLRKVVLLI